MNGLEELYEMFDLMLITKEHQKILHLHNDTFSDQSPFTLGFTLLTVSSDDTDYKLDPAPVSGLNSPYQIHRIIYRSKKLNLG